MERGDWVYVRTGDVERFGKYGRDYGWTSFGRRFHRDERGGRAHVRGGNVLERRSREKCGDVRVVVGVRDVFCRRERRVVTARVEGNDARRDSFRRFAVSFIDVFTRRKSEVFVRTGQKRGSQRGFETIIIE